MDFLKFPTFHRLIMSVKEENPTGFIANNCSEVRPNLLEKWSQSPSLFGACLFVFVFVLPNCLPFNQFNTKTPLHEITQKTSFSTDSLATKKDLQQEKVLPGQKQEKFEPLFEGWKKPELLLYISGRLHGYIEPCGCAGLDQMKGGLMRRHRSIKQLEEKGWPVIKLDIGDQVRRTGPQPQMKLATSYKALTSVMKYDAVGMGPGELKNDPFTVLGMLYDNLPQDDSGTPFISANVSLFDDEEPLKKFKVIKKNGHKVLVTSVVGLKEMPPGIDYLKEDRSLKIQDPAAALKKLLPEVKKQNCAFNVLLAFVSEEESRKLAHQFPEFRVIINKGVEGEPVDKLEHIRTKNNQDVLVMQMGYKGMYTGAIGVYTGGENPVMYQRIPMDHRFKDTGEIKDLFLKYQNGLEAKGLEGLIGKPVAHPSGRRYVGSKACEDCHDEEFDVWKHGTEAWKKAHPGKPGPHSHATLSLTDPGERTWVKRHHDPECLSCHVTGWNAQQFFAYKTGFFDFNKDKSLHTSGCENCHGPGSYHVEVENDGASDEEIAKARKEVRVTKKQAKNRVCNSCHDLNNSPDFNFEKYWPMVEHGGSE